VDEGEEANVGEDDGGSHERCDVENGDEEVERCDVENGDEEVDDGEESNEGNDDGGRL